MKTGFISRYAMPLIGGVGILFAVFYSAVLADPREALPQQLGLPASSPFPNTVSGLGLIEANTRNITIGSHLSGIVSEVLVTEGNEVEVGAPLFRLDDRSAKAEVATRESELATAMAQLEQARAVLADQEDQLKRTQNMKVGLSITVDRIERLKFAKQEAAAKVDVAKAEIEAAQARLEAAKVNLDKQTVTAPVAGRILKVNIRPGEFVDAGGRATMVLGNDKPLHVRVSIDENDLWRLKPEAPAKGSLRGNRNMSFDLKFVRLEPYVIPKTSLTGATSERVDTRVLEVLYSIDNTDQPLFIGQQVDVFIAANGR